MKCVAWLVCGWPADLSQAPVGFFHTTPVYFRLTNFTYVFMQAGSRHLVQALPPVFTIQYLTGKVDKNKTRAV